MSPLDLERAQLAVQMAGHGFGSYDAIRMCRHYLRVELLDGSVPLSVGELEELNRRLDNAVRLRDRGLAARRN